MIDSVSIHGQETITILEI